MSPRIDHPTSLPGFVSFAVGRADVVCAAHVADALRSVLDNGTLYRYAELHASTRPIAGRGTAYAASLPGDVERVVVRHNRHGGLFAPITGDLFLRPTRAPHELRTSERLRAAGVPTPAMLGYVVYGAIAGFARADVFSREVPDSLDLSAILVDPKRGEVVQAWSATRRVIRALAEAGARHHDLNVKNILLQRVPGRGFEGFALDVDRVEFATDREDVNEANIARLLRSARKWQRERGARISDVELRELEALLRRSAPSA